MNPYNHCPSLKNIVTVPSIAAPTNISGIRLIKFKVAVPIPDVFKDAETFPNTVKTIKKTIAVIAPLTIGNEVFFGTFFDFSIICLDGITVFFFFSLDFPVVFRNKKLKYEPMIAPNC